MTKADAGGHPSVMPSPSPSLSTTPERVDPRRVHTLRSGPPRRGPDARYVLYFCQLGKRAEWHPGLDYAIARADELGLPVLVYEGLRHDYPHASWRHHRFILDGVSERAQRLAERGIAHYFHLGRADAPRLPVVRELARAAALVVTDDYPAFIVPAHNQALQTRLDCPLYAVDSAGVAPMSAFSSALFAAFSLRSRIMPMLPALLRDAQPGRPPQRDSLDLTLPAEQLRGLRLVRGTELPPADDSAALDELVRTSGVSLAVRPAPGTRGGRAAGRLRLERFFSQHLSEYAEGRNRADRDVTSNLSPYFHYGMLSPVEVVRAAIAARPAGLADPNVAAFVEELVVRRELALNFCHHTPEHQTLAALPAWARTNLRHHAADPRTPVYDLSAFESARTHDRLWNAVQRELVETGEPHGYLRMLWGKKIIEWAPSFEAALEYMITLNDRYAYDGRDAVSYASFLWCFGLHDRPFPRRKIFGVMRPMSSESTGRKAGAAGYLQRVP